MRAGVAGSARSAAIVRTSRPGLQRLQLGGELLQPIGPAGRQDECPRLVLVVASSRASAAPRPAEAPVSKMTRSAEIGRGSPPGGIGSRSVDRCAGRDSSSSSGLIAVTLGRANPARRPDPSARSEQWSMPS